MSSPSGARYHIPDIFIAGLPGKKHSGNGLGGQLEREIQLLFLNG